MFEGLNKPFYHKYKDKLFQVVGLFHQGLVMLECLSDPETLVDGFVHTDFLEEV